jgi:X-Pro dipeptidyl-peptidase
VSKGILDSSNRDSLFTAAPAVIGTKYRFAFPTFPNDHVFAAGHRIGIVLVANYTQFSSIAGTTGTTVTLDSRLSKVRLPVVGGYAAAVDAGAFVAETVAPVLAGVPDDIAAETTSADGLAVSFPTPTATDNEDPNPTVTCTPASGSLFPVGTTTVTCTARDAHGNTSSDTFDVTVTWIDEDDGEVGGEVPGTLNLTVGGPASFGAFTPGLGQDYFTTLSAVVTSTAADAALSVTDAAGDGRMANGVFSLASPLQAKASSTTDPGGDYAALGGTPTPLLAYGGPVSNDQVTVGLKQSISSTEPLRTGTYSKTLTFTLSTTSP